MGAWREAVLAAVERISHRHRRNVFTRTELLNEEFDRIKQDARTRGRTPAQTLSRVLQELRSDGYLDFDGHGRYVLLESSLPPTAADLPEAYDTPRRVPSTIHRIVRDTALVAELKRLYRYRCQFCEQRIELRSGFYCEAHHLRPLGSPHNGPDRRTNLLITCPNHHVQLDYGARPFTPADLSLRRHRLSSEHIDYHNRVVCAAAPL